jgi:Protein of unknown function (DUF2786)
MPAEPIVRKIQALLDKAASTTFPAEAEALLDKAQALMSRHAIDEAMLAATDRSRGAVVAEVRTVEPPYASARAALLGSVARANGCRLVLHGGGRGARHCTIVGFPADVARAEALYQALSIQAVRAMLAEQVPEGDGVRAFRHSFLLAFARRIGERLRNTAEAARSAAESADATGTVALVLADRSAAVDAALCAQFPHLGRARASVSSSRGLARGRAAADRASLGGATLRSTDALPR